MRGFLLPGSIDEVEVELNVVLQLVLVLNHGRHLLLSIPGRAQRRLQLVPIRFKVPRNHGRHGLLSIVLG